MEDLSYLKIQRNCITGSEAQPYTQVLLQAWLLSGQSQSEPRLTLGTRVWGEREEPLIFPRRSQQEQRLPLKSPALANTGYTGRAKAKLTNRLTQLLAVHSCWCHLLYSILGGLQQQGGTEAVCHPPAEQHRKGRQPSSLWGEEAAPSPKQPVWKGPGCRAGKRDRSEGMRPEKS